MRFALASVMDGSRLSAGGSLLIDRVTHRYGGAVAVDDVTLDIGAGELVALLGPSGCGKTTLLRIVAGLIEQTEGRVVVAGAAIDRLPPRRRPVGIVFQSYALFPHMTVRDNVAYGLAARGMAGGVRAAEAMRMLEMVQLGHLAARMPRALSGGQQQRVALARALAVQPAILLLDEPFAALDKNLRLDMQIEIKRIQRMAGTTTLLVTHDQEEALSMADRVAVLSAGRLEQFAAPTEVYDRPGSYFVGTFVGQSNVLGGIVLDGAGSIRLDVGGVMTARAGGAAAGSRVKVCLRPEHLRFAAEGIPAMLELALPLGPTVVHEVRFADGTTAKIVEPREAGGALRQAGMQVSIAVLPSVASAFMT